MRTVLAGVALLAGCAARVPANDELPGGTVLATGACADFESSAASLASSADSLFWISPCDSSIRRASKLDGTMSVLVPDEPHAEMLAADDGFVYWARTEPANNGELVKASQLDGTVVVIASAQDQMFYFLPQQLVVDATHVYRSRFFEILAMPKDGSAPQEVFARGDSGPFLASDAEHVYWASIDSVHRQRKGTSTDEELARTDSVIFNPIAVTAGAVFYWSNNELFRIDKASGAPAVSIVTGAPSSHAFVSDTVGSLFWQSGDAIVRATDDAVVIPIVAVEATVVALAVDDERVYWIDSAGTIWFAPR